MISRLSKGIAIKDKFVFDGNKISKDTLVFISHAHEDHLPTKKTEVLASPTTIRVANERKNKTLLKPHIWNDVSYELFDAGHVPGSKMIKIKQNGISVLYTGDFSLHSTPITNKPKKCKADIIIMDATYFNPYYTLPEPQEVIEEMIEYINKTPQKICIFAYSFGKCQTLASYFDKYGVEYAFHHTLYKINKIIEEEHKYKFRGEYKTTEEINQTQKGIYILPINLKEKIKSKIKIGVSGWGKDPKYAKRANLNKVFPYSDHADFEDLLKFIERSHAEIIYGFQLNGNKTFFEKYIRDVYGIYAKGL